MGTENTSIHVQLIHYDEFQILKEFNPVCMHGKNSRMKHIRIAHNKITGFHDLSSRGWGSVAVVCKYFDTFVQSVAEAVERSQLVLRKSFCWKKKKRSGMGILQLSLKDGKSVCERFP